MENKEFAKQLEKRTKIFSITIIKLSCSLPNTPDPKSNNKIRNKYWCKLSRSKSGQKQGWFFK